MNRGVFLLFMRKYTLGDGMHPNAEGVARIVDGILPKVEELLAKTKPRP